MATVENRIASSTVFAVLIAVTACHLMNDTLQALLLAMYPMLRDSYALTFGQIGMITLVFQVTASLLQPLIGLYTDRRPLPYSLPLAPAFTLLGLVLLGVGHLLSGYPSWPPAQLALARRFSIRRRRASHGLPRAGATAWRKACSRWAAIWVHPSGRCLRPGSSCRTGNPVFSGSASLRLAAIGVLSGVGRWYSHHLRPTNTRPLHASHRP